MHCKLFGDISCTVMHCFVNVRTIHSIVTVTSLESSLDFSKEEKYSMTEKIQNDILQSIKEIYNQQEVPKAVLLSAGGGSQALSWFSSVPGASRFLQEAIIPYSTQASSQLKRNLPNRTAPSISSCDQSSAIELAEAALQRSIELQLMEGCVSPNSIGFSITCTLVTDKPKLGNHRLYAAAKHLNGSITVIHLTLSKGKRTRQEEEFLCASIYSSLICNSISKPSNNKCFEKCLLLPEEEVFTLIDNPPCESLLEDAVDDILAGKIDQIYICGETGAIVKNLKPRFAEFPYKFVIVPGSFNPLHIGHVMMGVAAVHNVYGDTVCDAMYSTLWDNMSREKNEESKHLTEKWVELGQHINENARRRFMFELSVTNAAKKALTREQLIARANQFLIPSEKQSNDPNSIESMTRTGIGFSLMISRDMPLFADKSIFFANQIFVVGFDTYRRIIDPKYYKGQTLESLLRALCHLRYQNVKFYVAGRLDSQSHYRSISDHCEEKLILQQSELLKSIHDELFFDLKKFRVDASSTEIRNSQEGHSIGILIKK